MSAEAVHEVARGRVWTGADAVGHGLVDQLGGLQTAVAVARTKAGLPDDAPVRPAVSVPMLAKLKPARSTDDPRAAASLSAMAAWSAGWGTLADVAAAAGLPTPGPLTMPGVRLR
jgi:protease-4